MIRWFLEGLAAYAQAHYGRGPIEGVGGFRAKNADKAVAAKNPANGKCCATESGARDAGPNRKKGECK